MRWRRRRRPAGRSCQRRCELRIVFTQQGVNVTAVHPCLSAHVSRRSRGMCAYTALLCHHLPTVPKHRQKCACDTHTHTLTVSLLSLYLSRCLKEHSASRLPGSSKVVFHVFVYRRRSGLVGMMAGGAFEIVMASTPTHTMTQRWLIGGRHTSLQFSPGWRFFGFGGRFPSSLLGEAIPAAAAQAPAVLKPSEAVVLLTAAGAVC